MPIKGNSSFRNITQNCKQASSKFRLLSLTVLKVGLRVFDIFLILAVLNPILTLSILRLIAHIVICMVYEGIISFFISKEISFHKN